MTIREKRQETTEALVVNRTEKALSERPVKSGAFESGLHEVSNEHIFGAVDREKKECASNNGIDPDRTVLLKVALSLAISCLKGMSLLINSMLDFIERQRVEGHHHSSRGPVERHWHHQA